MPPRGPDGQSNDKDENDEGHESNEAALRPLLFRLAHVSNKLSALFSGFGRLPVCRRTKRDAEDERSYDPKYREHCSRARESLWRRMLKWLRLTKPVLEHVHGKGGWFL